MAKPNSKGKGRAAPLAPYLHSEESLARPAPGSSRRTPGARDIHGVVTTSATTQQRQYKTPSAFSFRSSDTFSGPRQRRLAAGARVSTSKASLRRGRDVSVEDDECEEKSSGSEQDETATSADESSDEEMGDYKDRGKYPVGQSVESGYADGGVAGLGPGEDSSQALDTVHKTLKHDIRVLERGPFVNAYEQSLENATRQYAYVLNDVEKLLKDDLADDAGGELSRQVEEALKHRQNLQESILHERTEFVTNVVEPGMTKAQDLIDQLHAICAQSARNRKAAEGTIKSAYANTQNELEQRRQKFSEKETSKVLSKVSIPAKSVATTKRLPQPFGLKS